MVSPQQPVGSTFGYRTTAAEAVARACVNAVRAAEGIKTDTLDLPSASDLIAARA